MAKHERKVSIHRLFDFGSCPAHLWEGEFIFHLDIFCVNVAAGFKPEVKASKCVLFINI